MRIALFALVGVCSSASGRRRLVVGVCARRTVGEPLAPEVKTK